MGPPHGDADVRDWAEAYLTLFLAGQAPPLVEFLAGQDPATVARVQALVAELVQFEQQGRGDPPRADPLGGNRLRDLEVLREVGHGPHGRVLLARQFSRQRLVAVKILDAPAVVTPRARARLRHALTGGRGLDHPGIVAVEYIAHEHGFDYAVSRWLEGRPVDAAGAGAAPATIATLIRDAARAVAYAHSHGVLHSDLKPSNVLVDAVGRVHVTDFGLLAAGPEPADVTWLSPEQAARGRLVIDERADVYGLGALLFTLLAGRPPSPPDQAAGGPAAAADLAPSLERAAPATPPPLVAIAARALATDPDARYPSVAHLEADLTRFLAGQPVLARAPTGPRRWLQRVRRVRALPVVTASALLIALAAVVWGGAQANAERDRGRARLSVQSDVPAEVWIATIDGLHDDRLGPLRRLGRTPLTAVSLEPGRVRVIVRGEQGFAELTRTLEPATAAVVVAHVPAAAEVTRTMVRVDGGEFTFGRDDGEPPYRTRRARVAPFWIDPHEVSNGEFRRFCEATGRPLPRKHVELGYASRWDGLPVTGVDAQAAQDYAEWCGKRLPTVCEWQRAFRGDGGARFPPGIDEANRAARAVIGHPVVATDPPREREFWERGMATLEPVHAAAHDRTAAGLLHGLGNVSEWTGSCLVAGTVQHESRLVMGGAWDLPAVLCAFDREDVRPAASASFDRGFRCARSADPAARE